MSFSHMTGPYYIQYRLIWHIRDFSLALATFTLCGLHGNHAKGSWDKPAELCPDCAAKYAAKVLA